MIPVQMTVKCFPFAAANLSRDSTTLENPCVNMVDPFKIKSWPSIAIVRRACQLKTVKNSKYRQLMNNEEPHKIFL